MAGFAAFFAHRTLHPRDVVSVMALRFERTFACSRHGRLRRILCTPYFASERCCFGDGPSVRAYLRSSCIGVQDTRSSSRFCGQCCRKIAACNLWTTGAFFLPGSPHIMQHMSHIVVCIRGQLFRLRWPFGSSRRTRATCASAKRTQAVSSARRRFQIASKKRPTQTYSGRRCGFSPCPASLEPASHTVTHRRSVNTCSRAGAITKLGARKVRPSRSLRTLRLCRK